MIREPKNVREAFRVHRICVIVPTFNNGTTIEAVVNSILQYTDQVVVVNDGSTDNTKEILDKLQVEVASYKENQGKGWAIRQGFKRAIELGYAYAITIDSDGQHYADDLTAFVDAHLAHPNAIIIGARNMDHQSIPGRSSFGNKFSNFWFWFETGLRLPDTQSGYRLYPLELLRKFSFFTRKYEFEIEVLVRAAWRGIEMFSVPVKVLYLEKGKRVSHFRPFLDFSRISILNTVLVTLALLYIKPRDLFRRIKKKTFKRVLVELLFNPEQSLALKATSVGFGVFMGIVPIWGFQLIVAIAIAILLRLNKALVILAANISIPPCIPFILYGSLVCGSWWMGNHGVILPEAKDVTMDFIQNSLKQYLFGSITLAVAGGILSGLVTYAFMWFAGRKKSTL